MLICYLVRRRIGAYLDGALEERRARATARHLAACDGCRGEADRLRRLRAVLRRALAVPEPDWTGFWPAVVRRIQDAPSGAPAMASRRGWWRPRWAVGGALAAAVMVAAIVWQLSSAPGPADAAVIVDSADTDVPGGSVMVYATPERDLAVVWVFGLE